MAFLNVELTNGDSAFQTYGHSFDTVEEAKDYLAENGGGTIAIVPDEWEIYEVSGWQSDFDYDCDREILIVVQSEEAEEIEADLEKIMTASEVDEVFGLGDGTTRQACNRGQIRFRKSGGTLLIHRKDADAKWANRGAGTGNLQKAKEELQTIINTLLLPANRDMENVLVGYTAAEQRVARALELVKGVKHETSMQVGLDKVVSSIQEIDLQSHSDTVLSDLGEIVSDLKNIIAGFHLYSTSE